MLMIACILHPLLFLLHQHGIAAPRRQLRRRLGAPRETGKALLATESVSSRHIELLHHQLLHLLLLPLSCLCCGHAHGARLDGRHSGAAADVWLC